MTCGGERERELLFNLLRSLNIETTTFEHEEAPTCVDWMKHTQYNLNTDEMFVIKNLLLRDHKKKSTLIYIVANDPTTIDLKQLTKMFGFSSSNPLRFVPFEILPDTLNVEKGSLTPLSFYLLGMDENDLNDHDKQVVNSMKTIQILIDSTLFDRTNSSDKKYMFHPLKNTFTTVMQREDFIKFLQKIFGEDYSKFMPAQVTLFDFTNYQKLGVSL
jgi:hypothetical protein